MSFYNNGESLPLLAVLAVLVGEASPSSTSAWPAAVTGMLRLAESHQSLICVLMSCVAAVAISVTAFRVQQCISATAFITLNNVSKVPALILSYFLFDTTMTPMMALGLTVTFCGGYLYAL